MSAPTPTKQEIFPKVVTHLRKQGQRAVADGHCKYRTSDGLSCAVGCLIPDELYTFNIEGASVTAAISGFTEKNNRLLGEILRSLGIGREHRTLLSDLQNLHDGSYVLHWESGFLRIADAHGLTIPPCES